MDLTYRQRVAAIVLAALAAIAGFAALAANESDSGGLGYADSEPVGNLAAEFAVNGNGSATASIDIEVPPGTGGVAPSLSVTYDSHRGNGYLGMGWAVSGISAISRCGANYRLDGFKASVEYAATDRFCLDGRRLIATSGRYGADGSVYHTESETWTIVTSHGSCGQGPCSFTAIDKDGNSLSFGGSDNSRILAAGRGDGAVRTWAIDSFTDLNGNATTATYTSDLGTGEYYPSQLAYTANMATDLSASRFVTFNYRDRPDPVVRYLAGSKITVSRLLASIETAVLVSGGRQLVRQYVFGYEVSPATGRSRLSTIQVCDAQTVCWPATSFGWSDDTQQFVDAGKELPGPVYVVIDNEQFVFGTLADFNGDGIADYSKAAQFIAAGQTAADLDIYLGQQDGSFVKAGYSLPGPLFQVTSTAVVRTGTLTDVNGDGFLDYSHALQNEDGGTRDLDVYLGSNEGFTRDPAFTLPGPLFLRVNQQTFATGILTDMNGDGLPDYSRATRVLASGETLLDIYRGTESGFEKTAATLPNAVYTITQTASLQTGTVRDINGDGIADYSAALVNEDSGTSDLKVYVGRSPDFAFEYQFDLPGQLYWQVQQKVLESGLLTDVNGDGIPDYSRATALLASGDKLLDVYLGTGRGYEKAGFELPDAIFQIDSEIAATQGLLSDWNGDETTRFSKATKLGDGSTDLSVYLGSGTGFSKIGLTLPGEVFLVVDQNTYSRATYQDINGDGVTDFANGVCQMNAGVPSQCALGIQLAKGPYTDLLTSITNGFDGSTGIEYAPLTDASIYARDDSFTYPMRAQEGPVYVVARYVNDDGRGNRYAFRYRYVGAAADLIGAGWVGFKSVSMIQESDGRTSTIDYDLTYPRYGQIETSRVTDSQGNTLTLSEFSYVDLSEPALQQLGIHQFLKSQVLFTHYTGNAPDYTLKKTFQYDAYGNSLITGDYGIAGTAQDDVFYCSRYANDVENNRLGYWTDTKATRTLAGCTAFIGAASADDITWNPAADLTWHRQSYDARMNIATTAQYDDSNAAFATMSFTHDGVGNLTSSTDPAGATTRYEYEGAYQTYQTSITSPQISTGPGPTHQLVTLTRHEPGYGTLISTTDPNGNVTSQSIDGFGRVVQALGPDPSGTGVVLVRTTWQAQGGEYFLLSEQRPNWGGSGDWYWRRDYQDGLGRNYRSTRNGLKDGQSATIVAVELEFDASGRVYRSATPYYEGDTPPTTQTDYDVYNRPVRLTRPSGRIDTYAYGQGGLKITRTEGSGGGDARTFVKLIDSRGMTLQTVEPNGRTSNRHYDPISRLLSVDIVEEPRSSVYQYDSLSRLRAETHTNTGRTSYAYDEAGYLTAVVNASGSNVQYGPYDAMGRLLQRVETDTGGGKTTISLGYDNPSRKNPLGHLTGVSIGGTAIGEIQYAYDYDAYGGVESGSLIIGGDSYVYATETDPTGRITSATYPNGAVLSNRFLSDGHLGSVSVAQDSGPATTYASYGDYTALGQYGSADFPEISVEFTQTFHPVGAGFPNLKTRRVSQSANSLVDRQYGWDPFGDLLEVTDNLQRDSSASYDYTGEPGNAGMGYLSNATGPFGQLDYAYDQLGNVQTGAGVSYRYRDGTDQLISASDGNSFSYNASGEMVTSNVGGVSSSYRYDPNGNLLRIDTGSAQPATMVYDHVGRRVYHRPLDGGVETWSITPFYEVTRLASGEYQSTMYVPGNDGFVAAITASGKGNSFSLMSAAGGRLPWHDPFGMGAAAALLLWAVRRYGRPRRRATRRRVGRQAVCALAAVSLLANGVLMPVSYAALTPGANGAGIPTVGTRYFVHDHLGSVTGVVDDTGQVTARVVYRPYGDIDPANSSGVDDFRPKFVDSEFETRSALYHMGARYYSPSLARFISPDPQRQFANPYLYAGNNPVSAADPDGEFAFLAAMIIGAVVGAYFGAAAVNHDMNPTHWDWSSGKTYAGLLGGAAIGSVGAAAGGLAVEAGVAAGATGGVAAEAAGTAIGITGQALVGAGENAAYTAMGGGSSREILESAGQGALTGALFEAGGMALGSASRRFSRSGSQIEEEMSAAGRREERGAASEDAESDGGSCAIGHSFVAGTRVLMADGSARAIEDVRPGDRVAAFSTVTRGTGAHVVEDVFSRRADALTAVELEDGSRLLTTFEHPFWVAGKGWVTAGRLAAGDALLGPDGKTGDVVREAGADAGGPRQVFNFRVSDAHNYFVSTAAFVLVHNGKPKFCRAEVDRKTGIVTEYWDDSALRKRYPSKKQYQAIKRDIRFKARRANWAIKTKSAKPWTRVKNPVRTASKSWMQWRWKQLFGTPAPSSVRAGLAKIRPSYAWANQDVDEFLTRIQGGLTIREGAAWNQGPLNSWVNSTSGAAMGALARRGKPVRIYRFQVKFE